MLPASFPQGNSMGKPAASWKLLVFPLLFCLPVVILFPCLDKNKLSTLEQNLKEMEEECKRKEELRVDLELSLVEVRENLRKAESGPVTLGTTVDTTHLENASPKIKVANPMNNLENSPVNSAVALKNRPLSVMVTGKGTVLQKAKEWEKKGAS